MNTPLGCSVLVYCLSSAMSVLAMLYSITRGYCSWSFGIFLLPLIPFKSLEFSFIVSVSPYLTLLVHPLNEGFLLQRNWTKTYRCSEWMNAIIALRDWKLMALAKTIRAVLHNFSCLSLGRYCSFSCYVYFIMVFVTCGGCVCKAQTYYQHIACQFYSDLGYS